MCGGSVPKDECDKTIVVSFTKKLHKSNQFKMLSKVFSFELTPVENISDHRVLPFGTMFRHRPLGKSHHSIGQLWTF